MGRLPMNEDYLKQFRRMPDAGFVQKIHARLDRKERIHAIKRYSVLSVLVLIFTFGMVMTFSSTVRAAVLQTIEKIAGLRFDVTTNYPGEPGEEVTIAPHEYLSLEEAQSRFPSPVALPAYVPQKATRREDVLLTYFSPDMISLNLTWDDPEIGEFTLEIQHCSSGAQNCGLIVGEGALEEITLHGNLAVIVRGAWDYDAQRYDVSMPTAIRWKIDENTIYTLSSWSSGMSLDELVKIAESIP